MERRRDGLRPGRDAAGLIGDAVMSALEELVERLRDVPPDAPPAGQPPAARKPPARGAELMGAELMGAVVAAVVPMVLSRIDLDEILDRVDVQRIVDRVDVEEVVGRIDIDALLARVDVDALVGRVDLAAATGEALEAVDIGELVRDSTATIGSDVVEGVRSQAMRADDLLARSVDRILRRREPRRTALGARADAR